MNRLNWVRKTGVERENGCAHLHTLWLLFEIRMKVCIALG